MLLWVSLVAQTVKNLPAMQEIWVRSLGQADVFKGAFQGCMGRGGEQDGTVSSDSHLDIGDDGHNWLRQGSQCW